MFQNGYKCACDFQRTLVAHQIVHNHVRGILFSFVSHVPDTFSLFTPWGIFCRSLSRAFQYKKKQGTKKDEEAKETLPAPCAQEIQSA